MAGWPLGHSVFESRGLRSASEHAKDFPKLELTSIQQFGGWRTAQPKFFNDGGVFDQIYKPAQ